MAGTRSHPDSLQPGLGREYSLAEFEALQSEHGNLWELDGGRLVDRHPRDFNGKISTPNPKHSGLQWRIAALIDEAGAELGETFTELTLTLDPATMIVRIPDVCFASNAFMAAQDDPDELISGAPELCIEVLSPGDRMQQVEAKADLYFQYGAREVWIFDPANRSVQVHGREPQRIIVFKVSELLTGGPLLPKLSMDLAQLFDA